MGGSNRSERARQELSGAISACQRAPQQASHAQETSSDLRNPGDSRRSRHQFPQRPRPKEQPPQIQMSSLRPGPPHRSHPSGHDRQTGAVSIIRATAPAELTPQARNDIAKTGSRSMMRVRSQQERSTMDPTPHSNSATADTAYPGAIEIRVAPPPTPHAHATCCHRLTG